MTQVLGVLRTLSLTQPLVLLALVLAVPLVLFAARARVRSTPKLLRAGILVTRLLIAALVILALAQPTLRPAGHGRAVVFAVDTSDSVTADQLAWARAWVSNARAALPAGSHSSVIDFGSRAQLAGSTFQPPPTGSTDLSAALDLAGSIVQRDSGLSPEIVLLTDGWPTAGSPPIDTLPPGVAVSYVPLPAPADGQQPLAVIHALNVPSIARVGDRVDVQLDFQAVQPVDAQLELHVDQTLVADGPLHLQAGETQLSLPAAITTPGFVAIQADLRVGGLTSTLASVVVARPAGNILVLEDEPGDADALASLLSNQGLQVTRRPAASVPPNAQNLADFDGVVLVNTPATSLSLDQQRTLQSYVQDLGRGLVVVGGPRTFS
ncbi:MAG: hypothetical protein JO057_02875, partial [Chloroflexi bacterium]|nr:hypothetical protein [Chloroflexota bacterium]